MKKQEFIKKHWDLIVDLCDDDIDLNPTEEGVQSPDISVAVAIIHDIVDPNFGAGPESYGLNKEYDWETIKKDYYSITD